MGQKVHPYGFRLGVIKTWNSKWFEDKNYAKWLHEDQKLRAAIKKKFAHAGIAGVDIERAANKAKVIIHTSRPGIIIGKRGAGVDQLKGELQRLTENELFIDIQEIRKAETNAQLVAENIATQLERRVAFRRAMKKAQGRTLGQMALAANTPTMLKAGLVEGDTSAGVLASGQVVGVIDDLPTCEELVDRIVTRAADELRRASSYVL